MGCAHSRITIQVGCNVLGRRKLTAMSTEKVRMLHLHTASIESQRASPRYRGTLVPLFAHASAHATRFCHRRSMHVQRAGTGTRRSSCCEPLRREGIVGRSSAPGSRRAATLVPSPQLVLQRAGWVVKRGWWWMCTRVLLAEHASRLRDLNLAHGRRAPPEQPGRMSASGTTWAGRILRLLARSDAHSFAPCGRWREAVVSQSLRPLRWAVQRWRGRRASRRLALFSLGWQLARPAVLALRMSSCAAVRERSALVGDTCGQNQTRSR